jgi:hypothetical protein
MLCPSGQCWQRKQNVLTFQWLKIMETPIKAAVVLPLPKELEILIFSLFLF